MQKRITEAMPLELRQRLFLAILKKHGPFLLRRGPVLCVNEDGTTTPLRERLNETP